MQLRPLSLMSLTIRSWEAFRSCLVNSLTASDIITTPWLILAGPEQSADIATDE